MQDDGGRRAWWTRAAPALFAGFLLRAAFVWKHPNFSGDTQMYGDLAANLLHHGVYGVSEDSHTRPTLMRLPGYPLYLALCWAIFGTGNYLAVVWTQVGVDLLTCVLIGLLAKRLFGAPVGLAAIWLAALCPFTANYTAAVLTETISISCVALALWGMVAWYDRVRAGARGAGWASVVGMALALAVLLRPDGVLLSAAVLPSMGWVVWQGFQPGAKRQWSARRPLTDVGLSAALVAGCLAMWTWRNWHVFHVVQPLAPKYANDPDEFEPLGFARWYRTWAVGFGATYRVYWQYNGAALSMADLPAWAFDGRAQRAETDKLIAAYNEDCSSTPALEAAFDRLASERIWAHRVRYYVLLPLARLGDMWLRPRTELVRRAPLDWWRVRERPWASLFSIGYGLLNAGLLVAAVVGLVRWRRLGWRGYGVAAAAGLGYVALRCALLLTIDNSEPRYVLEAYPVVLLCAAVTFVGDEVVPGGAKMGTAAMDVAGLIGNQ